MFFKDKSISYSKIIKVERKEIKNYFVDFFSLAFERNKYNISITWKTIKESELNKFILERSSVNSSSWHEIGSKISRGSVKDVFIYNIIDANISADTSYMYRLKMLFTNNSIEYSDIIIVQKNITESNNISIHSLAASKSEEGININWQTRKEINFQKFNVEFTHDTNDVWLTIGTVYPTESTSTDSSYFFLDKNKSLENKLHYRVKVHFTDGTFHYSSTLIYNNTPNSFTLSQNYPNPFNNSTTIEFSLFEDSIVSLDIYNILGEKVKSFTPYLLNAGYHSYIFDATNLSSGIFYYRLTTNNNSAIKKMIYLK